MNEQQIFYSPTDGSLDYVKPHSQPPRGVYGGQTLEEIRLRYPDCELLGELEAIQRSEQRFVQAAKKVSQERFTEMLEIMPPNRWRHSSAGESFMMSEAIHGRVRTVFVRIAKDYWELQEVETRTHEELIASCLSSALSTQ